ncbi:hypothetical protein ACFQ1S_27095, partial [Kibdelosporangium lantanae]
AVAPLTAWAATEKLEALHDLAPRTALLHRIIEGDLDDTAATVAALGWPTKGPLTAFVITSTNNSLVAATVAVAVYAGNRLRTSGPDARQKA